MFTLWFTGSNCQGRPMVIEKVKKFLEAKGLTVIYLNGSNCESVKWAVHVAELLNKQGVVVIASFKSSIGVWFAKKTITKYIGVWVGGANKICTFAAENCDIRVDLNLYSAKSCASLVASYLYLYKVIKLSENGIDPIVKIREDKE